MAKLILRDFLSGIIPTLIAAAIAVGLGALAWLLEFKAIVEFAIGGIVGLIATLVAVKMGRGKAYFKPEEIEDGKTFWIRRIRENKFVDLRAARAAYLPTALFGIVAPVLFIVFFGALNGVEIWQALISALLGAFIAPVIFAGVSIFTLRACQKCGAVHSFIYDEEAEFSSASGVSGVSYAYGGQRQGLSFGAGGYNARKITKNGSRASCHCARCDEKAVITTTDNL